MTAIYILAVIVIIIASTYISIAVRKALAGNAYARIWALLVFLVSFAVLAFILFHILGNYVVLQR